MSDNRTKGYMRWADEWMNKYSSPDQQASWIDGFKFGRERAAGFIENLSKVSPNLATLPTLIRAIGEADTSPYTEDEEQDPEPQTNSDITNLLMKLKDKGISTPYLERALDLPAGTVEKWKGGEEAEIAQALLHIINLFPWMLKVADRGFTAEAATEGIVDGIASITPTPHD